METYKLTFKLCKFIYYFGLNKSLRLEDWLTELTVRAYFYLCVNLASVINPDVLEIYHPERGAVGDVKTKSVHHNNITLYSDYETATIN